MASRMMKLAGTAALVLAAAGAQAQELTIGTKLEVSTLDPHFFASFPSGQSHSYLYDRLVALDDDLNLVPGLTESWQALDDTTWEFRLRQGVTFHDGSAFDAEDVVATFNRIPTVPDSPNSFTRYVRPITEVEVVDDHTLRFHTEQPTPQLPRFLSNVVVIAAETELATTKDFNDGIAAIGTGPYKLDEWRRGEKLILERFDDYWGAAPRWEQVEEVTLANDGARTAALLSGDVDVIDYVPVADLPRLRDDDDFSVFTKPIARIHYVHMDSSRVPTPHVDAGDDSNPLADARVRKALSLAINRAAIVDRLLLGMGVPASQMLPSSFAGASENLAVDPYDPQAARSLLAEAGYGDGFTMTFHATNGRYPADVEIAQALAQMWTRIGLTVQVEALARTIFFPRATDYEFSIYTAQYGTETNLDMLMSMLHSRNTDLGLGTGNRARYVNETADALIQEAMITTDDAARNALIAQALETVFGEHGLIPLYWPSFAVAARTGLDVAVRANARNTAMRITPVD